MKKMAGLMVVIFISIIISSVSYASNYTNEKELADIRVKVDKTNKEIKTLISNAVAEANTAISDYTRKAKELEKGKEMVKAEEKLACLKDKLAAAKDTKKVDELQKEIDKQQDEITRLEQKLTQKEAEIQKELCALTVRLDSVELGQKDLSKVKNAIEKITEKIEDRSEKMNNLNQDFAKKINKIIGYLIDSTNNMSHKLQQEAEKSGVIIICKYVEVQIGQNTVLVDPLKITGW